MNLRKSILTLSGVVVVLMSIFSVGLVLAQVDQEAIINLSGEIAPAGICDVPRTNQQIRQTALQYSTIDRVSIFLNGEPLIDVIP